MMDRILNALIFATIFIASYVFFKQPFEGYITYIVLVALFPFFIGKFGIPVKPIIIFTPVLISGVIYIQAGYNTPMQFWKVMIGFFASMVFYEYVMKLYRFDVRKMFDLYMKWSFWVSAIGIFQIASYTVGFGPGYDYRFIFNKWNYAPGGLGIRMNSIFSEPSYFAAVVAPAFFVSLYCLIRNKQMFMRPWQLMCIIVSYFLTFSTLGYMGIGFCLLLFIANLGFIRWSMILLPIAGFGGFFAYNNVPEFTERIDGTYEVFVKGNIYSYDVNGSSFVLYNSAVVATSNWKRHPLFGTGLGSHATAYDKYSVTKNMGAIQIEFNVADANSMLLRLLSETGLYGVGFMLIFIRRNWVSRNKASSEDMWLISNGVLVIILLYLFRQGHYFLNGFPFFLWMLYYTRKVNDQEVAKYGPFFNRETGVARKGIPGRDLPDPVPSS